MAVKRRIIWMSDEEWALLTTYAKEQGETVSGIIREFWRLAATDRRLPTQAQRDAILRRVNKGG